MGFTMWKRLLAGIFGIVGFVVWKRLLGENGKSRGTTQDTLSESLHKHARAAFQGGKEEYTRAVGVFPSETSASTLATEIALRSSEEWALRRYLAMDALEAAEKPNPQHPRH